VFALGWIVSSYAEQIHAAGSLYDYVTRGLGERVGTAAGWLYYGGVVVLLTGLLLLMGGYLQSTIASEFKVNPLPYWAWTLLVIALIAALLYFAGCGFHPQPSSPPSCCAPGGRPAAS
jgi:amino acid transporter